MAGMEQVSVLFTDETVILDHDKIQELERLLGEKDCENVIAKAMEEVAIRLTLSEQHYQASRWKDLRKTAKSIGAIGDQIGMHTLTRVSACVVDAIDSSSPVAIAATVYRMLRTGDRSLSEYWDLQKVT